MAEALNTTRLFNKSFSDFLEEVRQDYLFDKYGGELAVGTKILQSELKNYLSRITNNFEDADSVVCDINLWEVTAFVVEKRQPTEYDLPIIFIIYRILLEQIEERFYDRTLENLKKDSNYKVMYFENPEDFPDTKSNILLESQKKGYNRAVENFNSLQQDTKRTKTETSLMPTTDDKYTLDKELEAEVLKNYHFWNEVNDLSHGKKNIFKNTTQHQFITMVENADFTSINKQGHSQRVKYNIVVLARILGDEWGEKAAKKLGTTLRECGKLTDFYEHGTIKNMYLP